MVKLPVISAKELIRALEKDGFRMIRQKGSHIILQKRASEEVVTTVVPFHDEIKKGTLRSILRKTKISPEQLVKLLTVVLGITPFLK
ncbi:MAG: type II toxin-antitoxin system HicA family toxin [Candidatus Omnitrophica bacterium]|nr:type II toxin-antitoxin system HicA family toxin [Candidatus Omnitrophota bacterium]